MSDAVIAAIIGGIGTALTGLGALIRWAVKVWAQVRREAIKADREEAALQREEAARNRDALIEQARSGATLVSSNAMLAGTVNELRDELRGVLIALAANDDARRARRVHNGSRSHGEHDD